MADPTRYRQFLDTQQTITPVEVFVIEMLGLILAKLDALTPAPPRLDFTGTQKAVDDLEGIEQP
jgi:hypothetical protein